MARVEQVASPAVGASHAVRALVTWLMGCAIFIGLPLVAWIPTGVGRFFDQPARAAFVVLAAALNAYAAIRIPEVGKQRPEPERVVGRQRWAVLLLQLLSIGLVLVAPYSDSRGELLLASETWRYAGLTLYACGFLTMHWAEAALGKQFSVQVAIQKDHELVTRGMYRYIRHPRYLGIEVFSIGLALLFRSAIGLMLAAAVAIVLAWRVPDEERLMEQEFGDRWRAYVRRSWRIVPFVY